MHARNIPSALLFVTFVAAIWIDYGWSDIAILQIKSIDEYAFHGSLLAMYKGITTLDLIGVFSYGFYSYGFPYWMLNEVLAFPFLDEVGRNEAIVIPRIISTFFMIMSLALISKLITLSGSGLVHKILTLLILLLMPGIWSMGTLFHPDFMMAAFLLLTLYFLSKSKDFGDKWYWISIICWGVACAVKIQAITFAPVIIWIAMIEIRRSIAVVQVYKTLAITLLVVVVCFILLNPYILHPIGADVWLRHFLLNIDSNATNHGMVGFLGLFDKLNVVVTGHYMWYVVFIFLLMASAAYLYKDWTERKLTIVGMASIFVISNACYLLIFVNKLWPHYYLTVFLFLSIVLAQLPTYKKNHLEGFNYGTWTLVAIFVLQLFFNTSKVMEGVNYRMGPSPVKVKKAKEMKQEVFELIRNHIDNNSVFVVSPYTPFPIKKTKLPFENIRVIYGAISKDVINKRSNIRRRNHPEASHILLRKDDVYFNRTSIEARTKKSEYLEAKDMINNWNKGLGDFRLINQSDCCFLYKRLRNI
jgi:4-amino-4-deoxy-L-arabinose transferase-like glycosyltransferase